MEALIIVMLSNLRSTWSLRPAQAQVRALAGACGQGLAEYALILAMVAILVVAALRFIGYQLLVTYLWTFLQLFLITLHH